MDLHYECIGSLFYPDMRLAKVSVHMAYQNQFSIAIIYTKQAKQLRIKTCSASRKQSIFFFFLTFEKLV